MILFNTPFIKNSVIKKHLIKGEELPTEYFPTMDSLLSHVGATVFFH